MTVATPMNVYWYFPHMRPEEVIWTEGILAPDDRMVVHTTPRPEDPVRSVAPRCEIRATLPAVRARADGSARWAVSRAATYVQRVRSRRAAVRAGDFDLCHVVYLNLFTDAVDLARLARDVPLVSSVHNVFPHVRRVPRAVERRLLAAEYRHGGMLVTQHDAIRRRLLEEFDVDPARVRVVPLPIAAEPEIERVAEGPPVVLFFGTLRRNKGVAVLLEAIAATRGELDARFVIAGRGYPGVEAQVAEAAATDSRIVAEIGYATVEHKRALYAGADLVVLPYTSFESQSGVLLDAYAHRLPLVVSDVGALGDSVREERTGWVVPPSDATALADALVQAIGDESARRAAAVAAAAIARARAPELVGAQLRAVYEEVLGGRR